MAKAVEKTRDEVRSDILNAMVEEELRKKAEKQWDKLEVPIEHSGRAITLPDDPSKMPMEKAVEALQRRINDDNQEFQAVEYFDAYPHDAAVAFVRAMTNLYGWASPQTVMTFFGPQPPAMLSIKVGPNEEDVLQCPMGAFKLPGITELVHSGFGEDSKGRPAFYISTEVTKKEKHVLVELAEETRRLLKTNSIYRGKAIRLGVNDEGHLDLSHPPEFLDVSNTTEANLLFDADIENQINTNILVPIKETALCVKLKIPLKRGVLLEGPFGTGKSLTARMTANVCEREGWTFVLLDKVQGLRTALEFANRYAPAVVFAEDIDRIASERNDQMNDLINVIDGVVSKSAKIMTVLTTNHVEKLNPVILRPGRLDAVISLRAPQAGTVQKLICYYAGDLLEEGADLTRAGEELAGQIPASIRECVERAKLGMIGRRAKRLSGEDIVTSAQTMKNHLALLNKEVKAPSAADRLASALRDVIGTLDTTSVDRLQNYISEILNQAASANTGVQTLRKEAANGGLQKAMTTLKDRVDRVKEDTETIISNQ